MAINNEGGVISSLFFAGLLGGFSHCSSMCGVFVLAQSGKRQELCLRAASLLPTYHLGRVTIYTIFGIISAFLSEQIVDLTIFKYISALLLIFAGVIFLSQSFPKIKQIKFVIFPNILSKITRGLTALFAHPTGIRAYLIGLILGFLPCGLLYAAIFSAASTGNVFAGGIAMFFFAIATIPALLMVSFIGNIAFSKFNAIREKIVKNLMAINGLFLIILGLTRIL